MPDYEATFIFNSGKYGWSETFYCASSNATEALGRANNVANARIPLLGKGNFLEAIRVSDILIPFDALRRFYFHNQPTAPDLKNGPWNGWLVELVASDKAKRPHLIRGVPDDWVKYDPDNPNIALEVEAFNTAWQFWKTALIANTMCIRAVDKDPPNGTPRNVTAISEDVANNNLTKLTVDPTDITVGSEFRLKGFKHPIPATQRAINRIWKARAIHADGVTIDLFWQNLQLPAEFIMGTLTRRVKVLRAITAGTHIRPAKRDTGRAFFVSAGRRPRR